MGFQPHSLSSRILVGATAAVALALMLAGSYFAVGQQASLERLFDRQNQSLSDTLAAFSIEQLVSLDYPALEQALQLVGKNNDNIKYIEVMQGGRLAATYGDPQAKGRIFYSDAMTREFDGRKIGEIKIVAATKDHDELLMRHLSESIITLLLIFATMGFSLRWLLLRGVIKPIQVLTARTEEAIATALPELLEDEVQGRSKKDEISQLDYRFTALLEGLQQRDAARNRAEQALLEHQNNLEKLVDQRTRALQLAQKEAVRLNKVKSEFLAAASHDLRQPIQALNLFHAALALSGLNEEQNKLNQYVGMSLNSLGEILNTLLDISKIDAGIVVASPKQILTSDLFSRIEAEFASVALDRKLRFKLFFPLREMVLFTDPELLFSLLRNLIDNAIKYSEDGGVLVGVRRRQNLALLQVWDTGIGISQESKQDIFEEYVQLGNPERDNRKGLGLGLSIVSRLARLLDTEVRCHSKPGQGTLFEFLIPLAVDGAEEGKTGFSDEALEPVVYPQLAGQLVFVIEDDQLIAQGIALSLRSVGLRVVVAESGTAALSSPVLDQADFYISDYRLPGGMDGLELLAAIESRRGQPVKAILMTGGASPRHGDVASRSRWPVLLKPVELSKLLQMLTV